MFTLKYQLSNFLWKSKSPLTFHPCCVMGGYAGEQHGRECHAPYCEQCKGAADIENNNKNAFWDQLVGTFCMFYRRRINASQISHVRVMFRGRLIALTGSSGSEWSVLAPDPLGTLNKKTPSAGSVTLAVTLRIPCCLCGLFGNVVRERSLLPVLGPCKWILIYLLTLFTVCLSLWESRRTTKLSSAVGTA